MLSGFFKIRCIDEFALYFMSIELYFMRKSMSSYYVKLNSKLIICLSITCLNK